MVEGELPRIIENAIPALAAHPRVFKRGPELVHVVGADDEEVESRSPVGRGTPIIRRMVPVTIGLYLGEAALLLRKGSGPAEGKWVRTDATSRVTETLSQCGTYRGVRELVGVRESPFIRPNGTICQEPGYDPLSGFLFAPPAGSVFLPVAEAPTRADAQKALAFVRQYFQDFPFETPVDADVPIAAMLTMVGRPAIRSAVPCFAFDANTQASGKTRLTEVITLVAQGRRESPCTWPAHSWREDAGTVNTEELEKIISGYALKGAAAIVFDNIETTFGGAPIAKVLSAYPGTTFRVLRSMDQVELPWPTVVFATGNNLSISRDLDRRVIRCRLRSTDPRPEFRTKFKFHPLLDCVERDRPKILHALLTILRAYHVRGRNTPDDVVELGSFESWTAVVVRALVWAGGANVIDLVASQSAAPDPNELAWRAILPGIHRWCAEEGRPRFKVKDLVERFYPAQDKSDAGREERETAKQAMRLQWGDFLDALHEIAPPRLGGQPDRRLLGRAFSANIDKIHGGFALVYGHDRRSENTKVSADYRVISHAEFAGASSTGASCSAASTPSSASPAPAAAPAACACSLNTDCPCSPCSRCGLCTWPDCYPRGEQFYDPPARHCHGHA